MKQLFRTLFLLLVGCCIFIEGALTSEYPEITTRTGEVRGKKVSLPDDRGDVYAFLGIPYAEPPVGDLRFHEPVPVSRWDGVMDTTEYSNSCMQQPDTAYPGFSGSEMWNTNTPVSEDCLYLNVWTPAPRPRKAAVMVWIYGGGFYSGTASLDVYDGKFLVGTQDVIMVSMNYRVGALGFLATGDRRATGNYGMYDQVMALNWVKHNIGAFGGDPSMVTIFGESAGGASVGLHLLSPISEPHFDRAIMQSGAADTNWSVMSKSQARLRSAKLGQELGCDYDDRDFVDCLRSISANTLSKVDWVTEGFNEFPWVPIVDGKFLMDEPKKLMRAHRFKKADILLGANGDEGTYFILYQVSSYTKESTSLQTYDNYLTNVDQVDYDLNMCSRSAVKDHYTNWGAPYDKEACRDSLDDVVGDRQFLCPVVDLAHDYANENLNVYMYYLHERDSTNPWPEWMGVMHGDDCQFVFGMPLDIDNGYTNVEVELSETIMAYWANFAKTGNPNKGEPVPYWPKQTFEGREYLKIPTFETDSGLRKEHCLFWSELVPKMERDDNCKALK